MWKKTKMELANRLSYFPLARLMLMSFWTRMVLLVLSVGLGGMGLCIPKIWTATPPDVTPIIRVSVVDLIQAWSLRRHAERQLAAGQVDDSLHSWGAAIANNTADPRSLRGYLRAVLKSQRSAQEVRRIARYSVWLLRLTANNPADLELVATLFHQCGMQLELLELLRPLEEKLSPTLEAAYLKALFNSKQYAMFAARLQKPWNQNLNDPELDLYRAAYVAAGGPQDNAKEALQILERAAASSTNQTVANRLLLEISNRKGDVAGCQRALNALITARADKLADHSTLWRLLFKLSRKTEASQLVQAYVKEPTTMADTLELAEVCELVGQRKRAMNLLSDSFDAYGFSVIACIRYCGLLVEDKQWAEVRALALKLRMHPGLSNSFLALASVIEAEAELGEGRREAAEAVLRKLPGYDYEEPEIGLVIAESLIRAKMVDIATPLLSGLEPKLERNAKFWRTLFDAARAQTNVVLMSRAAQRRYELDPSDPVAANTYAGVLLFQRTQPELALSITKELFAKFPDDFSVRLNHAAALVANQNAAEARQTLLSTRLPPLSGPDLSQSFFLNFEVCRALGLNEEAWRSYERINPQHLYSSQRQWLENAVKSLPPRTIAAPSP